MFWSGNFIAVRELNILLKEENVTLTQVLEADDILQECKADNKALTLFLTRPEILAELITLITEEPPKDVELASQYRHASVACEVLTSHLSMLIDRLSTDAVQMNRLCDFINRPPPLNPLLASYFSKTIEMLLERSPKQDWYLYHITCLCVLDFLKARRDFLPNLLRHIATSAIADTFKYFIRLDDLFNKVVMEWLEEHQFLESLIQVICGTYSPGEITPAYWFGIPPVRDQTIPREQGNQEQGKTQEQVNQEQGNSREQGNQEQGKTQEQGNTSGQIVESDQSKPSEESTEHPAGAVGDGEKVDMVEEVPSAKKPENQEPAEPPEPTPSNPTVDTAPNTSEAISSASSTEAEIPPATAEATPVVLKTETVSDGVAETVEGVSETVSARMSAVASANAAALLCDIILTGCAVENSQPRPRTGSMLMQRLQSEALVRLLLQSVFTSDGGGARRHAVVNGCRVLAALLHSNQYMAEGGPGGEAERRAVELALAPHLPLLHQELLTHTQDSLHSSSGQAGDAPRLHVGAARVEVAALLAQLASSEVPEVPTTLLALGTAGVLLDLMFSHPHNNFLHAQVTAFVSAALVNCPYRTQYARHLILECDILTRLLDAYEENENKDPSTPRAGYMGHVILLIRRVARALDDGAFPRAELPTTLGERWSEALQRLEPLFQQLDTPLGGYYPSEYSYEDEMCLPDTIGASYDFNDMATSGGLDDIGGDMNADDSNEVLGGSGTADFMSDGLADDDHKFTMSQSSFLELANQAISSMWDEDQSEQTADPLNADVAPWEGAAAGAGAAEEGWAQFSNDAFGNPVDPFANSSFGTQFDAQSATASDGFNSDKEQFWNYGWGGEGGSEQTATSEIEQSMQNLHLDSTAHPAHPAPLTNQQMEDSSVELANNLLTAMSSMTPEVIANIVNANMNLDIEDRQTDEPSHDTPKDAELDSANNKDDSRDTTECNEGNVSER